MIRFKRLNIDFVLFFSTLPLVVAGLVTMKFLGDSSLVGKDYFFNRQIIWFAISLIVFFAFSFIDWRFLRKGELLIFFYLLAIVVFAVLIFLGKEVRGASSWIELYFFSIEPVDPFKILFILILAKYFSRRHIEIANIKHIFVSGIYFLVPTLLIFFQPDFGSAMVVSLIWFGMIMVSGVKKSHILALFLIAVIILGISWLFLFKPYQKDRILAFLNPFYDIKGAGYNAYQSMIAVGSGQMFGKGIGFGTQSRLEFLPEHQTDFIFAAFAEEWGFVGVLFLFLFLGIVIWRILKNAGFGQSNFESFFGIGLAIFLMAHILIHVGMNIGLLPVTGINLPFMSYGGSNLLTIYGGLGILMGMRKYARQTYSSEYSEEFLIA